MHDSKEQTWRRDADADARAEQDAEHQSTPQPGDVSDSDGWQQYRRWISKSPAPRGRRTGLDPSLYTWKGYRTWTEQVKRNWNDS